MKFTTRTAIGSLLVAAFAAASLALSGPASAGPPTITVTFPDGLFQGQALTAEATIPSPCDSTITEDQISFVFNGSPADGIAVSNLTDGGFTFVIPSTLTTEPAPAVTDLAIAVTCDSSGSSIEWTTNIGWAQIKVTNTVIGDGPQSGYPFAVNCTPLGSSDFDLFEFDLANGESWSVFAVTAGGCTVEQLDNLGATSSSVSPEEAIITSSSLFPVEATNTFPEAPAPTPTPTPTPEPTPVVTPTFTG